MIKTLCLAILVALALSACGGGGSSGSTPSTPSFPVAQAIANFVAASHDINYSTTGNLNGTDVTGTGTISYNAAVSTTFEGQAALSQTGTISGIISGNGKNVPYALTGTDYYSTDYDFIGTFVTGSYCVARSNQQFPSSVQIGDTASLGTSDCYQDSSKNVITATEDVSYVVEADTASTVIFNEIINIHNLSSQLISTTQLRWRIDQVGNIAFVSQSDTDYTSSPASLLTFTAN